MSLIAALALTVAVPPAGSCQAALGPLYEGTTEEALPGRVDGATLPNSGALIALRRARGDATITIVGGSFPRADLRAARLHNICFLDTDFSGSDWRGADAPGIGFVRANLEGAQLSGARMPAILLRAPNLKDADAAGADWSGGRLDGGWDGSLENLILDRADLRNFDFACGITIDDGCPMDRRISLDAADLSGADLHGWWLDADLSRTRFDRTAIALHHFRQLGTASIAGPLLLRGGDVILEVSPAEVAEIAAAIREPAPVPDTPSFDCAAARSRAERMICAPDAYALRDHDRDLAEVYRRAATADPSVATSQRAWLAARDRCADAPCMERAYASRRDVLLGGLAQPAWLRPGVRALFVDDGTRFDDAFRETPLYRRLLPIIVGGAGAQAAVRVNPDGSIDAEGQAIGGNAHMCSLSGRGLRFDRGTGWFSGPYRAQRDDPADFARRPMPVLRFEGESIEIYRNGSGGWGGEDPRSSDYASCGARASFGPMIRVPASDAEVDRLLAAQNGD